MKLNFDLIRNEFMVGDTPLRDFYIEARKKAHLTIPQVETRSGLQHPTLYQIEAGKYKGVKALLVALETIGYSIDITGG